MQRLHIFLKRFLYTLIILFALLYGSLFILFRVDRFETHLNEIATSYLKNILQTDISIAKVRLQPFNKIALYDVFIADQNNDTLLYARKLATGIHWIPFIHKELSFSTAQISGFKINLNRKSPDTPLNIQFLIEAFKPQQKRDKPFPFEVDLRTLIFSRGSFRYDVFSKEDIVDRFDKNHILIEDFNSVFALNKFSVDSVNLTVKDLRCVEKSGLRLEKIRFNFLANRRNAELKALEVRLPQTVLNIDSIKTSYHDVSLNKNFFDHLNFKVSLDSTKITLQDFTPLLPQLKNFESPLELDLHATGNIHDLRVSNCSIRLSDHLQLNANGQLVNILNPEQRSINGTVKKLFLSPIGVKTLIKNLSNQNVDNVKAIDQLGNVLFRGEISGEFSNLLAKGDLQCDLGLIRTNVSLGKGVKIEDKPFFCKGNIQTENFNIGKLYNTASISNDLISCSINLDIKKEQQINGHIEGQIPLLVLKGYNYQNVSLNGSINGKCFQGAIQLDDPNGQLTLDGLVDLKDSQKMFNFKLNASNFRFDKLNIAPQLKDLELNFSSNTVLQGNKIDAVDGFLVIDSILMKNKNKIYQLHELRVDAIHSRETKSIKISSNLLNGQIQGKYNFAMIYKELCHLISNSLPFLEETAWYPTLSTNDFNFNLQIDQTDSLSKVIKLPVILHKPLSLKGYYNGALCKASIVGEFPSFQIGKFQFEDGSLVGDMPNDKIHLRFTTIKKDKNNQPLNLSLNMNASEGILRTRFDWSNLQEKTYSGNISTQTSFKKIEGEYPLRTKIDILPSILIFNDSIWNVRSSHAIIDSAKVKIENFEIDHHEQHLQIGGCYSKNSLDTLKIQLQDMSLDYIFQILNKDFIQFGGLGSGTFAITSQNKMPSIQTEDFYVKDFTYNNNKLGNLNIASNWDAVQKGIHLEGIIHQKDALPTKIQGGVYLAQDSLHLNFDANRLNIGFVHVWTDKILQNFRGRATGNLTLYGKYKQLNLIGDVWGEDVTFGIDYLNTEYSITDSIKFDTHGIHFNNISVYDKNSTQAIVNGDVSYNHFKNINYDIAFLIPDQRTFHVFNVTEKQNPVYWGNVYASGSAHIYGDVDKTWIDVTAKSEKNSRFYFSLSENVSAGDYQFITFRDANLQNNIHKDSISSILHAIHPEAPVVNNHEMYINLQLEATPDIQIALIMDPATGDQMKGNGSGNIRIEYNKTSDFKMYGNYKINKGSYYFNLQDVISRDFSINEGSTVTFKGEPLNSELDINASYQVSANLTDLDESFSESKELSRTTVPVQCLLSIHGGLRNPDLNFDIKLPTVTQDVDRQVKSIISTDEMMNRQILYLLVLNKFYTPDYLNASQQNNRYGELASVASSTLSSQLNNLLGQISENWNIGTNIKSEKGDFSDVEVQLALSSQLLNNRLLFNGNLGYKDDQNPNNSFIGDFDLEYLLNPLGSLRLKAYNHYNDRNYSAKSSLTTQGVGIVFKKDFESWKDLFDTFIRKKRRAN